MSPRDAPLSAAGPAAARIVGVVVGAATAHGLTAGVEHRSDESDGAADTCVDMDGIKGAVALARTAFHTAILGSNGHDGALHLQNALRTDVDTQTATGAFLSLEFQRNDFL